MHLLVLSFCMMWKDECLNPKMYLSLHVFEPLLVPFRSYNTVFESVDYLSLQFTAMPCLCSHPPLPCHFCVTSWRRKRKIVFQATVVMCPNPLKGIKCIAGGDHF